MRLFRTSTRARTAPNTVIEGRPWLNEELDAVLDQVPTLEPAAALDLVLEFLRPRRFQIEEHVQALTMVDEVLVPSLPEMRSRRRDLFANQDLVQLDRRAREDGADLLAILGATLIRQAWQVRGGGLASTVSRESFDTFGTLLEEADDALTAALILVPHHAAAAKSRLTTALGLGATGDEWWARFEVARTERSTLYPAHTAMLTGLTRKWYGSDEQMFEFARSVAAAAPAGDPVSAILPLAHVEHLLSVVSQRKEMGKTVSTLTLTVERRKDLAAIAEASQRWCGNGTDPVPTHPWDVSAHNLFGWFLATDKKHQDRARWHLERTAGRMSFLPWSYLRSDPVAAFQELHAELGLG